MTTQYASQVCLSYNFEEKFMQAEGLGVEPPRRCSDCRGCQKCSFRGQQYTEQETMEYKAIEPGIRLKEEMGYL